MAWESEIPLMIRHLIDDLGTTPTYTDDRLEELTILAAQLINSEVDLYITYTTDIDNLTLSPDPTVSPRDDAFISLVALKAACIVDQSEARKAAGQGIAIQDGRSSIDLRSRSASRLTLLKEGWCKEYSRAKLEYQVTQGAMAGHAVLSPFRAEVGKLIDHNYFP
jgi:hypothetical protein